MAPQDVQAGPADYVPDADRTVVRARDAVAAVGGDCPDGIRVALEAVVVERILVRRDRVVWVARAVRLEGGR